MRGLVTGATGFIGSHVVEALLAKGYQVSCLVREASDLRWLRGLQVQLVYGDLTQETTLREAVREAEFIYHLGGITKARRPRDYYEINHRGTRNLVEACLEWNLGLKKFVYLSTLAALGPSKEGRPAREEDEPHPITDYGRSKLLGEVEVLKHRERLPVTIVRAPAVYGPRDQDLYPFFRTVAKRVKPVLGKDEGSLSLCYVQDLATGLILAGENEKSIGQAFFISEEGSHSWSEVADLVAETLGVSALRVRIPPSFIFLLAYLSEAWAILDKRPALLNRQKAREITGRYWVCDITKAKAELGFKPCFPLREGLKLTVAWYRKKGWL